MSIKCGDGLMLGYPHFLMSGKSKKSKHDQKKKSTPRSAESTSKSKSSHERPGGSGSMTTSPQNVPFISQNPNQSNQPLYTVSQSGQLYYSVSAHLAPLNSNPPNNPMYVPYIQNPLGLPSPYVVRYIFFFLEINNLFEGGKPKQETQMGRRCEADTHFAVAKK